MSDKTIKFSDNLKVHKKNFRLSKQRITLNSVRISKIVVSDKYSCSNKSFKYFIGYKEDDIIRPSCIVFPQMSEYIKYFDNGGKNMSFKIEDDNILVKFNEI